MVQVWCVQMALSATKALCAVWATRKSPMDVFTNAALPTADSGELASMVIVIPPVTRVPFTVGSAGTLLGDVRTAASLKYRAKCAAEHRQGRRPRTEPPSRLRRSR